MPYKDYEKQKAYQLAWYHERRAKFFESKKCARGPEGCEGGLQLDHKDPSKKWKHRIFTYSWEKIEKEAKKCQILCEKHHYEKTADDVRNMRQEAHDTPDGYEKYRCRCSKCAKYIYVEDSEYHAGISLDEAKVLA